MNKRQTHFPDLSLLASHKSRVRGWAGSGKGEGEGKERGGLLPQERPWPQVPGSHESFFPASLTSLDLHLSIRSLRLRKHPLSYSCSSSLKFLNENSYISSLSLFAFEGMFPSPSWSPDKALAPDNGEGRCMVLWKWTGTLAPKG